MINLVLSNQNAYIKKFNIRNRNNSKRGIISPKEEYKILLRELNSELKKYNNPPDFAHCFINERNIKTNAELNIGKKTG